MYSVFIMRYIVIIDHKAISEWNEYFEYNCADSVHMYKSGCESDAQYTPPTTTQRNCRRRRYERSSQLAHDDCRRIRSTIWKLTKQTP